MYLDEVFTTVERIIADCSEFAVQGDGGEAQAAGKGLIFDSGEAGWP